MAPIRFEQTEQWLTDVAWPFWSEVGVDRERGGFVEFLTLDGRDGRADYKRTRAQARQIYCFSQAALMDFKPAAEIVEHGWRFLTANGPRGDGGWVRRMGAAGGVLDATCDLYDMSFVLYAHAWRYRLSPDAAVLQSALSTVEATSRLLRHPTQLGWLAEEGDTGPRQQNPHMHLVEAAVELAQATGDQRFADLAAQVIALFLAHFYEPVTGVLHEFFGQDWGPLATPDGAIVEPGHLAEWSWLLYRAQGVLSLDLSTPAKAFVAFARDKGRDTKTGLVFDQTDKTGRVLNASHRSWPQTEMIKALLADFEQTGADTRADLAVTVANLHDHFLAPAPPGGWHDHFGPDGALIVDKIPSTTLYHLQLAFTELRRLRDALEAV